MKTVNTTFKAPTTSVVTSSNLRSAAARSAFRLGGMDLNPDMRQNPAGSPGRDWILQDANLKSMVLAVVAAKRRKDAAGDARDPRTDEALAVDVLAAMGYADAEKPATAWSCAKFVAGFTVRALAAKAKLAKDQQLAKAGTQDLGLA